MTIILASSSKPRQMLLHKLQTPFEIAIPDVDETPHPGENPAQLVQRLAEKKAFAVSKNYPDALIIGADQVGVLDETILCKPMQHAKAVQQLQSMSGKQVRFYIGLCVLNTANSTHETVLETFDVIFRALDLSMIENYLMKEHALHCAGSFKAEGLGIALVKEFHGSDFSALVGLPLIRLTSMLENAGIAIL